MRVAVGLRREHQAGTNRRAVENDGAGAANAMLATDMGAGEQQVVAQEIAQQQPAFDLPAVLRAVHRDGDVVHFGTHAAPRARSLALVRARVVSTPAMCRWNSLLA